LPGASYKLLSIYRNRKVRNQVYGINFGITSNGHFYILLHRNLYMTQWLSILKLHHIYFHHYRYLYRLEYLGHLRYHPYTKCLWLQYLLKIRHWLYLFYLHRLICLLLWKSFFLLLLKQQYQNNALLSNNHNLRLIFIRQQSCINYAMMR